MLQYLKNNKRAIFLAYFKYRNHPQWSGIFLCKKIILGITLFCLVWGSVFAPYPACAQIENSNIRTVVDLPDKVFLLERYFQLLRNKIFKISQMFHKQGGEGPKIAGAEEINDDTLLFRGGPQKVEKLLARSLDNAWAKQQEISWAMSRNWDKWAKTFSPETRVRGASEYRVAVLDTPLSGPGEYIQNIKKMFGRIYDFFFDRGGIDSQFPSSYSDSSDSGARVIADQAGQTDQSRGFLPEAEDKKDPASLTYKKEILRQQAGRRLDSMISVSRGAAAVKAMKAAAVPAAPHRAVLSEEIAAGGNNLYVAADAQIDGDLVIGTSSSASDLTVMGGIDVRGMINNSRGEVIVNDNMTVNGIVTASNLSILNSATIGLLNVSEAQVQTLDVAHNAHIRGAAMIDSSLNVGGNLAISGTFSSGHALFTSLGITGPASARSMSVADSLSVSGPALISSNSTAAFAVHNGTSNIFTVNGSNNSVAIAGSLSASSANLGTISNSTWNGNMIGSAFGGIGTSTSGWNGIAVIDNGAWSASGTLSVYRGGTGLNNVPLGYALIGGYGNSMSATSTMYFSDGGNVGIGTTTPGFRLDVAGIINATALYVNGTPYIGSQWTTSGTNIYYSTGNVGIGTTSPYAVLAVGGEAAAANFNAYSASATSTLSGGLMVANGFYVLQNGRVGIGTSSPSQSLAVDGNVAISGVLRVGGYSLPNADGALNQVLKTDGTGSLTWQNDLSGSGADGIWAQIADGIYNATTTDTVVLGSATIANNLNTLEVDGGAYFSQNIGIGTSSPFARLSVVGQALAEYYTATSTSFASVFPYASTTVLSVADASFLGIVRSGVWNGSAIGISYGGTGLSATPGYGQLLLGDNSGGYSLQATSTLRINTDDTVEGPGNLYFTNVRTRGALSANLPLAYDSGTGQFSVNQSGNGTDGYLSASDWAIFNNKISSSSIMAAAPLTFTSATGQFSLSQAGPASDGYLTALEWNLFNNKISSTTVASLNGNFIPKWNTVAFADSIIYENGTNIGIGTTSPQARLSVAGQTIADYFTATTSAIASNFPYASTTVLSVSSRSYLGTVTSGTWNGSAIGVIYGGTGLTITPGYGQILLGNNANGYDLISTSTLNINTDDTTEGVAHLYFTDTRVRNALGSSAPITYNSGTGVFGINQSGIGSDGYLSLSDWNIFNSKISSSSLSAVGPLAYVSATGAFSMFQSSAGVDGYLSAIDWNVFNNKISSSSLSALGPLSYDPVSGQFTISLANSVTSGYLSSIDWNIFNQKMGSSTISGLSIGYIPNWNGNIFTNSSIYDNGNVGIGTSSPYAKLSVTGQTVAEYFTATSSTATSTFPLLASAQSSLGTIIAGTWQGSVIGPTYGGTGLTSFTQGQILVASANNTWQATSTLKILPNGNVGIGPDTGPVALLDIAKNQNGITALRVGNNNNGNNAEIRLQFNGDNGNGYLEYFNSGVATSSFVMPNSSLLRNDLGAINIAATNNAGSIGFWTGSSQTMLINSAGNLGIGTSSPYAKLSVAGQTVSEYFTATSTSIASTFSYASTTVLSVMDRSYLGTVSSGIWNGAVIASTYGGTGQDSSAWSGVPVVNSGVWGASTTLGITKGGTGISSVAQGYSLFGSSGDGLQATSTLYLDTNGNIGIGTTTTISAKLLLGQSSDDVYGGLAVRSQDSFSRAIWIGARNDATARIESGIQGTGNLILNSGGGFVGIGTTSPNGIFHIAHTDPKIVLEENDASADNKKWQMRAYNETFYIAAANDIWNSDTRAMQIDRSGLTIDAVSFPNGFVGIGTTTPTNKLTILDTSTQLKLSYDSTKYGTIGVDSNGLMTIAGNQGAGGNVIIDPASLLGVGTTSVAYKLDVYENTANFAARIYNYGNADNRQGLIIQNGLNANPTTASNFIEFRDGDGTVLGSVHGNGAGSIAYATGGADYAEYFQTTSRDLVPGELVCIDVSGDNHVSRCVRGNDPNVMGIVSSNPAFVGNNERGSAENDPNYELVGLIGQVKAKVSAENGPIRPGDSLTTSSSTAGFAMRADAGDSTVGVALEGLSGGKGDVNVLISRRNKSMTVEQVEQRVTEQVALMGIEDEIKKTVAQAVSAFDLHAEVDNMIAPRISSLQSQLSVNYSTLSGQIENLNAQTVSLLHILNNAATLVSHNDLDAAKYDLQAQIDQLFVKMNTENASTTDRFSSRVAIDRSGNLLISDDFDRGTAPEPSAVAIVEISASSSAQTAFVVNQDGLGDIADFRERETSVLNIAGGGKVSIVGEMRIDGRIMACAGGACPAGLENEVDQTMGDVGIEGKVVAGAFEGYCPEGMIWINGSAKYGTMPGFCVMERLARQPGDSVNDDEDIVPVLSSKDNGVTISGLSQGEAQIACQTIGSGYHLMNENEWMTIAEDLIRVSANDADRAKSGLQLATSSGTYLLSNDATIFEYTGAGEWTDQTVLSRGKPEPASDEWREYSDLTDYHSLNIAPPYYYDHNNGIGMIRIGNDNSGIYGFVRGRNGVFSLDLTHSPAEKSFEIGFRCAK